MGKKIPKETMRVNLILPLIAKEELDRIADEYGMSLQDLIRLYIATGLEIEAIVQEDGEVFAQSSDGKTRVIADQLTKHIRHLLN